MSNSASKFLKIGLVYLLAGVVFLKYSKWPNFSGHAHVPLSSFPVFLVLAPLAPVFVFEELMLWTVDSVLGTLFYFVPLVAGLWWVFRKSSKY
jgi:hypothetical protein